MGPALYIIAILGCGDGGQVCQQVRLAPATYASHDACALAAPGVLARNTDVDAPEIRVECRSLGGPAMVQAKVTPAG